MPSLLSSGLNVDASDDWSDDFPTDLPPSRLSISQTSSPSSSSSKSSSHPHPSSPLRKSVITRKGSPSLGHRETAVDDMDFDLPDSFPARSRSTTGSTDSSSVRDLSRTVRTDPSGKGTVTHLAAKPPSLPAPTVRAKAKAIEKAWEADIDLDAFKIPRKVLAFPARKRSIMPDADDLEDLGFDLCDDLDQSTIKIDATLRQKLPPPQGRAKTKNNPPYQDTEDPEADFILPLNLTNLSLATQQPYKSHARPRVSNSSTATDLDSPNTSASGKKSTAPNGSPRRPRRPSPTPSFTVNPRTRALTRTTWRRALSCRTQSSSHRVTHANSKPFSTGSGSLSRIHAW